MIIKTGCVLFCITIIFLGCSGKGLNKNKPIERETKSIKNQILFPIKYFVEWGFINQYGEVVVKPQFDKTFTSNNGMAGFETDGKFGFVNMSGDIVIDPKFDDVGHFNDGYAVFGSGDCVVVKVNSDIKCKRGIIDKQGNIVVKAKYDYIGKYSDKLFIIEQNQQYGLLNIYDKIVVKPQYEYIESISNGLGIFKSQGKYGYLDIHGNELIPAQFSEARSFNGKSAIIAYQECTPPFCKWGLINKNGTILLEPDFRIIRIINEYSEGLISYAIHQKWSHEGMDSWPLRGWKYGYMNTMGETIITQKFAYAGDFRNGYAPVALGNDCVSMFTMEISANCKWTFINKNGEMIIEPTFAFIGEFSDGLAGAGVIVQHKDDFEVKYGYINESGTLVIPAQFAITQTFSNGRALVAIGDNCPQTFLADTHYNCKWGLIDNSGDYIIEPKYDELEEVSDGIYEINDYSGYLNRDGKVLWMSPQ